MTSTTAALSSRLVLEHRTGALPAAFRRSPAPRPSAPAATCLLARLGGRSRRCAPGRSTRRSLVEPRSALLIGVLAGAFVLTSLAVAAPAAARDVAPGAPFFERDGVVVDPEALPLLGSFAEVDVTGDLARVTLVQLYQNLHPGPIEVTYVFPGSTRAAVTGMTMTVGDRVITATIRERAEAREVYEEARDAGQTAALLEQDRPNVLRMNVANILPGEVIQVEIEAIERLRSEDGELELVIPAIVAPRYFGGASDGAGAGDAPRHPLLAPGLPWRQMRGVSVDIRAPLPIVALGSPTHPLEPLAGEAPTFYSHRHAEFDAPPRDFVLRFRLAGPAVSAGVSLYERDGEGWFMVNLEPPHRVTPDAILPRELVFILDTSGSMDGWPMETSKALIGDLLASLRRTDRFNLVSFAGSSEVFAAHSLAATRASIDRAWRHLGRLQSGGGTELASALERAFGLPAAPGFKRTFVVITDGLIWDDARVYRSVRERLGDTNFFAFGVHDSPNRHLLERLARAGQGEPIIVSDPSEAADAVARFISYIEAPILSDITVEVVGLDAEDVLPAALPELFARRPLVVTGRYRGPARGVIRVRGQGPDGPFEATLDLADAAPDPRHQAIATLWARERIERLSDEETTDPEVRDQIVALGLRHRLLTRHTSFVAVDQRVRTDGGAPELVEQPAAPAQSGSEGGPLSGLGAGGLGFSGLATGGGGGGGGILGGGRGLGGGGGPWGGSGADLGGVASLGGGPGASGAGAQARHEAPTSQLKLLNLAGARDPATVMSPIRRRGGAYRGCYTHRLGAESDLSGSLVLKLEVDAEGWVTSADVIYVPFDQMVAGCVRRALRRIRFPAADGASTIHLELTFSLP